MGQTIAGKTRKFEALRLAALAQGGGLLFGRSSYEKSKALRLAALAQGGGLLFGRSSYEKSKALRLAALAQGIRLGVLAHPEANGSASRARTCNLVVNSHPLYH